MLQNDNGKHNLNRNNFVLIYGTQDSNKNLILGNLFDDFTSIVTEIVNSGISHDLHGGKQQ